MPCAIVSPCRKGSCVRKLVLAAATAAMPMLVAADASAVVRTWVATNGNWSTAANWSGGVVPTASDDAGILGASGLSSRSVTYDYTGPAVTLLFLRIDRSAAASGPNSLIQSANTLHTATEQIGVSQGSFYTLSGGTNTVDGLLTLGVNGASGGNVGAGGYNLSGTGFLSAGTIVLGDAGFGSMNMSGGTASFGNVILGNSGFGAGQLVHSAGSISVTNLFRIGLGPASTGTYNLSGTGALAPAGGLIAGDQGSGAVNQSGGLIFNPNNFNITLGNGTGSSGVYTLSGGNINNVLNLSVGVNGAGTFNQSAGSSLAANLRMGSGSASTGIWNLSGTGQLSVVTSTVIGGSGAGSFTQTGGTFTSSGNLALGEQVVGKGTYTLNGASAELHAQSVTVGSSGAGTFIQSAGTHTVSGSLGVGSSGDTSTGIYTLSGGTLQSTGTERIGGVGVGVFNQTGGTHTAQDIYIADSGGGAGTYTLSGNGILDAGVETIGGGGGTTAAFNQTGGTHHADGIFVAKGAYTLDPVSPAAVLSVDSTITVGGIGAGTFVQTGGTVNVGIPPVAFAASPATLNISGFRGAYQLSGGTLNVSTSTSYVGLGGTGTFVQTGGTANFDGLLTVGGFGGAGTYLLSGGTLRVTPSSYIDRNAGAIPLDGLQVLEGGNFIFGGGTFLGKFSQLGGTVSGTFNNHGTFVYESGSFAGQLTNGGTFVLNGATFSPSTIIVNEDVGVINATGAIAGPGMFNRGVINLTGPLSLKSVNNTGAINVGVATTLTPDGMVNFGRINLLGGKLIGAGSISNSGIGIGGGGLITGGGTIEANIVQDGGTIRADDPARPLIFNAPITITNPASQIAIASNSVLYLDSPLSNSAIIALQGSGAKVIGAPLTNTGTIKGNGQIDNQLSNSGILRADAADHLTLTAFANTNSGTVQLVGGAIEFSKSLANFAGGVISGDGSLFVTGGMFNSGSLVLSGGTARVHGNVTSAASGKVLVTGGAHATFYDNVTNQPGSTFKVSDASVAAFLSPVTGLGAFTGNGTTIFESTASGAALAAGTTIVDDGGSLSASSVRQPALIVRGFAQVPPDGTAAATSKLQRLSIDGGTDAWTGKLDLSDNALVIDYASADPSPLPAITNQIRTGFANGSWNANGITSSAAAANASSAHRTALGYSENAALNLTNFRGQSVDATSVLVRYTFAGDGNLDGQVDLTDFTFLAANFNGTNKNWLQGDFTYDGNVDLTDFTFLASNFNRSLSAESVGSAVPEPIVTGFPLAATLSVILGRRRLCRAQRRTRHITAATKALAAALMFAGPAAWTGATNCSPGGALQPA
jgi:fibronectin-binding autotransporter adhesin